MLPHTQTFLADATESASGMATADYIVLIGYFVAMAAIGIWAMKRTKKQEDYFMGGRSFGKILQTFAAFGAGTGSADPINTAKGTFSNGLAGMWTVMYWLFVTPIYWITAVWYRRMRHITLGDWFTERYESKGLGAGYTLFAIFFYILYTAMLFKAISVFASPLTGIQSVIIFDSVFEIDDIYIVVVAFMVVLYGALGGITAAFWTDLIQGLCIIALSVMLIPLGLEAVAAKFGEIYPDLNAFQIIHRELPASFFEVIGSEAASDFPLYNIIAIVILNMVGVVVQPHFIVTGGGSAKSENNARIGLVTGNLLKRFCTVGWALTALIALTLFADNAEVVGNSEKVWGVASRELLGAGFLGLMLACLLAALMSSADAYMLVSSGLVVRNVYAAYIDPNASEKTCVNLARITGGIIIFAAMWVAIQAESTLGLFKLTWYVPVIFAAPFWMGIFWRRATRTAAWTSVVFCTFVFFITPVVAPALFPALRTSQMFTQTTDFVEKTTTRIAAPSDVARRKAGIALWEQNLAEAKKKGEKNPAKRLGRKPNPLTLGQTFTETTKSGGLPIFWKGSLKLESKPRFDVRNTEVKTDEESGTKITTVTKRYKPDTKLEATGYFQPDYLLYDLVGVDLQSVEKPMLEAMAILPKVVTPFLIVFLVSLLTRRNSTESLDRYFAKMNTPVDPDPQTDAAEVQKSYDNPRRFDHLKIFKNSDWEFVKPRPSDVIGFFVTLALCFGVIYLTILLASIGSS